MMPELTIAGILKIRAILGREHPRKKIDDAYRWRGGGGGFQYVFATF